MNTPVFAVWNLLWNGIGSFIAGWVVAQCAIRAFRVQPGRAHVALLTLPFAKVVLDLGRGIPSGSFLWLRARGMPRDIGTFQLGFGFKWFVPIIHFALDAKSGLHTYSESYADLFATLFSKKIGAWAPLCVVGMLTLVGGARLVLRLADWVRSWKRLSRMRAHVFSIRSSGWRRVRVIVSDEIGGTPFTAGVIAPMICFPKALFEAFSDDEREAAILHELAHVAHFDVVLVSLVGIVEDVFWFVPGLVSASRRLRQGIELAADAWAVQRGAAPLTLASALVRTGETLVSGSFGAPQRVGFGSPVLGARMTQLLEGPKVARWGFQNPTARLCIVGWVSAIAIFSVLFGNH
jgi:BlaR1 peptidase M56